MAALTLLTACDTTEEAFEPGDKSRIKLSVNPTSLEFGADNGASAEFEITSTVHWTIDCKDSRFSFSQNSGKGNGTISVTAQRNSGSEVIRSSFQVLADNAEGLDIDQTVSMEQNIVLFPQTLDISGYTYPETGGEQTASQVLCTINWKFETEGSTDGFSIDPGMSGSGRYRAFDIRFVWEPNYTQQERSVTLSFIPQSESDQNSFAGKMPEPFTLTQAAGTLPDNISIAFGNPTYTECEMDLSFESSAPIEGCGVILKDASGTETRKEAPLASPDDRNVKWTLDGLTEGARYIVTPYVVSKVGESLGESQELSMDAHARMPEITSVSYNVKSRSVDANVTFEGEMEVNRIGLEVYNDIYVDSPVASFESELFSKKNGTETVGTTDFLSPNSDYEVRAYIIFTDSAGNAQRVNFTRERIHTPAVTPNEDDNNPLE